ncbi:AN1-type zinc finger protein 2A [Hylaeus anthracinus]|uniref:AN1-type zinc finger protein 2A n=1 Tax=Hylaeus volcanicus TaxID=313075 RepID=UPI0023B77567|nr:AN1-type zinc finger protein 2A [Hylaeus volcanicus]XP_053979106.1 AN1-type zinc finger protein 2A [Hylaeus volcanicus]XP_053979107.1 AN1-type zinc finger protein 2A [Hylaeus volcanicus]XP_054003880.1 AN1-type zinc finger protein 2A [Hylaeus anthracinus]XP_054003881.1 AN1-type zinc finger protein 2A [Hylaeus anthracinus]XP_054003883.1 AN1-type zinc finger protein 2A [Hylaeus anthracinus]
MEFPNLGEHCSENSCNRLDFLPLKCDACSEIFCTEHISYINHSCPSAYKKDARVPVCPLCDTPIPIKRGDSPDIAVGQHIDRECQSDLRKSSQKIFSNRCSSKGCKIKEIVQVHCSDCGENFCLKHRHPTDHACIGHEEAIRRKRLDTLKNNVQMNRRNGEIMKSYQGSMNEDEALARALQASMLDEDVAARRRTLETVPSGNRDRCRLS